MQVVTSGENVRKLTPVVTSDDPGERWDVFMAGHPDGHLMQSRAWAWVKADTGWTPLFLRLEDDGRIRAAALILRRKIRGTTLSLLYIPQGPVLEWDDSVLVEIFAAALRQVAGDQRAFLVQADPAIPADRTEVHDALTRMGFQREQKHGLFRISQPIHVMRIPMDRYDGPQGLLHALPHKTRYNISLAERRGVIVTPRTDRDAFRIFHHLLWEAGQKKGFPVRGDRFHEAIWRHCIQTGLGEYLFATHQGRMLAAIQVIRFGRTAWYMYGALTGEEHKLMATYLLQWTGLSRSWEAGCRCYDMRGVHSATPQPEDPEYGVYEFKRKFAAELVSFVGEYDLVIKPWAYDVWRWVEYKAQQPAKWAFRLYQNLGSKR